MDCISDITGLWPSPANFAAAIGVRPTLVNVWRHRRTIPAEYWAAIEAAAAKAGIQGATASDLARLAAKKRLAKRDGKAKPHRPAVVA